MMQTYTNSPQTRSKDALKSELRGSKKFIKNPRQFGGNRLVQGSDGALKLDSGIVDRVIE